MRYKKAIEYRYSPVILAFLLMMLHFLSGYPGGMSYDTADQFEQAITFNFSAYHPPVPAMLWSILNRIYTGPQLMLLLHLALLWGSVLFFYYSDLSNRYKLFYFIIPLVPNILSNSVMIWKDVGFANSYLFVFSGCIYYFYHKKQASPIVLVIFSLIDFYSAAAKFQAKFIIPILCFLIVSIATNRGLLFKLICTIILSFILIFFNSWIISKYSVETHAWQLRGTLDVVGVAVEINDDSLIPDYVKKDCNYDFVLLKQIKPTNDMVIRDKNLCRFTQDTAELKKLHYAFINTIIAHPISYLKFRSKVFNNLMNSNYPCDMYFFIVRDTAIVQKLKIHEFENNILRKMVIKWLKLYPRFLQKNLVSLVLLVLYTLTIVISSTKTLDKKILVYFVLVGLGYSGVQFFTIVNEDYRYCYVVRLFTFFVIPIYLKLIFRNSITQYIK